MPRPQAPPISIARWTDGEWQGVEDRVASEEPLQLLLDGEPLSVIMRTPGADLELALGLLIAEGVIAGLDDVAEVRQSAESAESDPAIAVTGDIVESNQIDVRLRSRARRRPQRSFLSSSACGVCGATTIESLALDLPVLPPGPAIDAGALPALAVQLRERQGLFEATGGLHAAGLFDPAGTLVHLREDIGRHNAVDKVVGRALLERRLPLWGWVLAVSGRAGYELVQKAVAAGITAMVAVGAPSSLAVATAERFDLTLVGFLRERRFNVYAGRGRLTDR
ncbi:MAG: formate dehydrogenase accessory sulfurtransferase FdhD [Candidatus Limnocylindria bacterium]